MSELSSMVGGNKSAAEIIILLFAGGVGTGVLVLPTAMASVGFVVMLGLLAFGSLLSAATTWMLFMGVMHVRQKTADNLKEPLVEEGALKVTGKPNDAGPSYGELLTAATVPSMSMVLDVMLLLYSGGAVVTYYLFLASFVRLLPFWPASISQNETIVIMAAVTYPATLFRSIGKLAKLANVVVIVLFCMTFSIWFHAPGAAAERTSPLLAVNDWDKSIAAFCICIYAFVWHNNCVIVARELSNPTPMRCAAITLGATTLLCAVYALIAFGGYWSFGSQLEGMSSIMDAYKIDDPLFITLRLALTASLLVAIDLNVFPLRESCIGLVRKFVPGYETSAIGHAAWSLFVIGTAAGLAIFFPEVTKFITFMGGVFGPFMCIVFPALISRMVLSTGTWLCVMVVLLPISFLLNLAGLGLVGRPI